MVSVFNYECCVRIKCQLLVSRFHQFFRNNKGNVLAVLNVEILSGTFTGCTQQKSWIMQIFSIAETLGDVVFQESLLK